MEEVAGGKVLRSDHCCVWGAEERLWGRFIRRQRKGPCHYAVSSICLSLSVIIEHPVSPPLMELPFWDFYKRWSIRRNLKAYCKLQCFFKYHLFYTSSQFCDFKMNRAFFFWEVMGWETKAIHLCQGRGIFFCKGLDSKCFQFCRPQGVYWSYSTLPLWKQPKGM